MKTLHAPLLALILAPMPAFADDAAVRHCRTFTDSAARMQCYDAMPLSAPAAPPRPPAAASATPADPRQAERNFGLAPAAAQRPREAEAPQSISSSISGAFDGWQPNQQIKLANGQVWRVVDGSEGVLSRPANDVPVKVVRGLLGALFMEIEGSKQSPKVRRVQ